MTETEGGGPPYRITRWGHQNTIIYLSGIADRTAGGSLDFDGTADGNPEGSSA
jgi:hypothetical protein